VFLHIGGEYSISEHLIIGIFDFDAVTQTGSETIRFLKNAEAREKIEHVSSDFPRSVVLTLERVYLSPISAQTLRQRLKKRDILALDNDFEESERPSDFDYNQ
jgi:hypothetical protein